MKEQRMIHEINFPTAAAEVYKVLKERKKNAGTFTIIRQDYFFVIALHLQHSYSQLLFLQQQSMDLTDATTTGLTPNAAAACEQTGLTNTDLLQMTHPERTMIHGSTLFALKYRVLPCILHEISSRSAGGYDDIYSMNMTGAFAALSRGHRWCGKRKQGGMIHATR